MKKQALPLAIAAIIATGCQVQNTPVQYPPPATVSGEMAVSVGAPLISMWQQDPATPEEWHRIASDYQKAGSARSRALAEKYGVTIEENRMNGVRTYSLTPKKTDTDRADKVILYLHGGGYVVGHGMSGTYEAIYLSGLHNYKIVCVDYRMAPDHPYPAAINDAFAVYRELLKTYEPDNIAVFGTSTGGAMTLILALQAYNAGVPMPGALVSGTPWADMGKVGDSYVVNAGVDNILGNYDHMLRHAAGVYARGESLTNPLISPVYASDDALKSFPPTLLISGTRDLFLSNTARMHTRLMLNNAPSELLVYEALSHAQYYLNPLAPETFEHYGLINAFLERTLLKN